MLKKDSLIQNWIIVYFLATILFFAPVMLIIGVKLLSWSIIGMTFLSTFSFVIFKKHKSVKFSTPFKCIFLMIIITPFVSYVAHGQGIIHGVRVVMDVLPYTFFFFLCKYRVSIERLEKVVWVVVVMYIFVFFAALAIAPTILFDATGGNIEELNTGRGITRVKILGTCALHFAFFISVNKGFLCKQKKYIFLAFFFFLVILLNVSRQHIVFALIVATLMVLRSIKWYYYVPVLVILGGGIMYVVNNIGFIQQMIELTSNQAEDGTRDNIRVLSFLYYVFEYNDSIFQVILGNGIPYANSPWGEKMFFFSDSTGLHLSDVGYAKIYFYWGVIGILLFLFLLFKVISMKSVDKSVLYCRYYLIFVLLTNVASHSFFTEGVTIVFAIYILDESNRRRILSEIKLIPEKE